MNYPYGQQPQGYQQPQGFPQMQKNPMMPYPGGALRYQGMMGQPGMQNPQMIQPQMHPQMQPQMQLQMMQPQMMPQPQMMAAPPTGYVPIPGYKPDPYSGFAPPPAPIPPLEQVVSQKQILQCLCQVEGASVREAPIILAGLVGIGYITFLGTDKYFIKLQPFRKEMEDWHSAGGGGKAKEFPYGPGGGPGGQ